MKAGIQGLTLPIKAVTLYKNTLINVILGSVSLTYCGDITTQYRLN